jgi:hypothetical protein
MKAVIQIAFMLMKDSFGQGGTMYDYIQSDAELRQNPRYANNDGTFKDRPGHAREDVRPVFVADPNASQAVCTLAIDEYKLMLQTYIENSGKGDISTAQMTIIKNFFMDPVIWGKRIAKIAAGLLPSAVTDLPIDMWRRILLELDLLDDAATVVLKNFYQTPW